MREKYNTDKLRGNPVVVNYDWYKVSFTTEFKIRLFLEWRKNQSQNDIQALLEHNLGADVLGHTFHYDLASAFKQSGYTSLIVAIDCFKTSHNSLQFNVDRFVKILPAGRAEFLHNGQISSIKIDDVVAIVSKRGEGIHVDSSGIHLGIIDNNKLLYLDDRDVAELIYNFIEYALLREEIRRIKKMT